LNNSIALLLDSDIQDTNVNSNDSVLDDDSLNELILDLFDDILITTSDNSKDINEDAMENSKSNDDLNVVTFRNIGNG